MKKIMVLVTVGFLLVFGLGAVIRGCAVRSDIYYEWDRSAPRWLLADG
jgi:hypothetical protein